MADSPEREISNGGKRVPWYFISIICFFILPISILLKKLKTIDCAAFIKSFLVIMLLGYAWSFLVTSQGWWTFNPQTMLGIEVIKNLPLEEVLFYPLGGALSILIYIWLQEMGIPAKRVGNTYAWIIVGITSAVIICIGISILQQGKIPWYLVTQLILYNGLSLGLWVLGIRKRIMFLPAALTVGSMTLIGFFWNWLAFTQGWWAYHAVLGWMFPPQVPVDDWNFFIFAPLAAVSVYENIKKVEK